MRIKTSMVVLLVVMACAPLAMADLLGPGEPRRNRGPAPRLVVVVRPASGTILLHGKGVKKKTTGILTVVRLPPGDYRVVAYANGHHAQKRTITITKKNNTRLRLILKKRARIKKPKTPRS